MQLKPRIFTFRADEYLMCNLPEGKQYGLIAQEVESVFKDIVLPHSSICGNDGEQVAVLGINYNALIPILVSAMQEHQCIIDGCGSNRLMISISS